MPRNGSGTYALPTPPTPFVNGTTADATQVNAVLSDIAAALTGSMAADGQTPFTGTLSLTHPLVLANGVAVQGKDTSGTARPMLWLTPGNQTYIQDSGGAGIVFVNQANTVQLFTCSDAGNVSMVGALSAGGNISAAAYGGNNGHSFNFGWNGSVLAYVDGTYVGALQFQGGAVGWGNLTGVPAICYNNGGTYGINVTGNAATASSATTAGTCSGNAATASSATAVNAQGHSLAFAWTGSLQFSIDGTSVGTINYTISDYRLKHSVADFPPTGALDTIQRLRPVSYRLRDVGPIRDDGMAREGFIAHELAEVLPAAVVGEKDATDADGAIKPQSLAEMPIIATLVKAVQELHARLDALENRR